jgi:two-component system NarL family sensor kinase
MAELSQNELIFILVSGSGAMLLLTGGIAIFIAVYQKRMLREQEKQKIREQEYNQRMIQAQLESQEAERKRIAADLHDSLGSLLWSAKLNSAFIERSVSLNSETSSSFQELHSSLDQSLDTVRRIVWELAPEGFQNAGLSESVHILCRRIDGKGLTVEFAEDGVSRHWNDSNALLTFRIIQELMSNCVKHAKANTLNVQLRWTEDRVTVAVSDDGVGLVLQEDRSGLGWWNIKQRARQLKADISIGHPPSKQGTSVVVKIPLSL